MANRQTGSAKRFILPGLVGLILLAAMGYFLMGLFTGKTNTDDATAGSAPAGARPEASGALSTAPADKDVATLLEEARAAHEKGQYIDPEGANEVELYLRVLEKEPENRIAQEALLEIIPFATDQTDKYIREGNIPQAERTLALLRRADPNSVVLTSLAGKVDQLRRFQANREQDALAQQQQQLQQAQQRAAAQQTPDAATPDVTTETSPAPAPTPTPAPPRQPARETAQPAVAAAAADPTPAPAPAGESRGFRLVKRVNPTYPQRALRQRITGWVEMSFTITAGGDVTNITVVDAQPRREFDREATRALSQWKFEPKLENGKAVAATARQRLEFRL